MNALPSFLTELINNPPPAGTGVHGWLFRVARNLHAHLPAIQIVQLLEERTRQCGRHVPLSEITAAVKNSLDAAWTPTSATPAHHAPPRWPAVDQPLRESIVRDGHRLVDLWEASPIRTEDGEANTEEIIDRLFPGNPLLCCGQSSSRFNTRPREDWRGQLSKLQLIVSTPMTKRLGLTKEGKESEHTLDNTAPRRFLVVEFDTGPTDEHAALLLHLSEYAPLCCAGHSGGKSLHGWFFVAGQPEEKVLKFFRYACRLGADSKLWCRSQFCRMPDGTRDNGKRQTVYFFDPSEVSNG